MDVLSAVMFGPAFIGGCVWAWKNRESLMAEYAGWFVAPEVEEEEVIELDIHAAYWEQVNRSPNGQFATRGE